MADIIGRIAKEIGSYPKASKQNPHAQAIARKLGIDTPEGLSAFKSQFKSSHPTSITQRTELVYPQVSIELQNRLLGGQ